jgi:hypothetical protein
MEGLLRFDCENSAFLDEHMFNISGSSYTLFSNMGYNYYGGIKL